MYLGIDVGGTKTLLANFSHDGRLIKKHKFATPKNYSRFLEELEKALKQFKDQPIDQACCALPGEIDRKTGTGINLGNLPWQNVPVKTDISSLLGHIPVKVENDANLAGLHEALLYQKKFKKVMYLTIGTGIKSGIIVDGEIDPVLASSEPGQMIINYGGKLKRWEDFASGRALVNDFGKPAKDIEDRAVWYEFARRLTIGLSELVAVVQPEVIIIGGSLGTHFEKYSNFLRAELQKYENKMVRMPPIIKAQKPQEAVIYGCYDYLKAGS